ncbi:hypothetical protein K456DRAFT_719482 [Colletotrichum gloeosporioides 23]|nr:hypothetical protein K456DRAFT_719482 [Colletotrichum gloeosporioides 23]
MRELELRSAMHDAMPTSSITCQCPRGWVPLMLRVLFQGSFVSFPRGSTANQSGQVAMGRGKLWNKAGKETPDTTSMRRWRTRYCYLAKVNGCSCSERNLGS